MQTWPTRTRQTCTWDKPQRSGACNRTRPRWRLAVHRERWPPGRRSRQAAWQGRPTTEVSGNHGVIGSHQEAIKSHQQVIRRSSGGHQEVIRRSSAPISAHHHLRTRLRRARVLIDDAACLVRLCEFPHAVRGDDDEEIAISPLNLRRPTYRMRHVISANEWPSRRESAAISAHLSTACVISDHQGPSART